MQIIVFFVILIWITPEGVAGDDGKQVTALILARGGSKGIPLKNIAQVAGWSLVGRTVATAREANVFDEVWVSTDHPKIAEEAEKCKINPLILTEILVFLLNFRLCKNIPSFTKTRSRQQHLNLSCARILKS